MDARNYRESLRRLRLFANEADLTPDNVSAFVQPFIAEWKTVPVPNRKESTPNMAPEFTLSDSARADLSTRIRVIGMNLHKQQLRGIDYHNQLQRQIALLAPQFDCRGWVESAALFDDPDTLLESAAPPTRVSGRVDVIWARARIPVAIFEIDSTTKLRSFQKLKEGAAPHKFWIYFGRDVWSFKTFLQQSDPLREILPVIVPQTFIPSFADRPQEPGE